MITIKQKRVKRNSLKARSSKVVVSYGMPVYDTSNKNEVIDVGNVWQVKTSQYTFNYSVKKNILEVDTKRTENFPSFHVDKKEGIQFNSKQDFLNYIKEYPWQ